jgi:hypothetical protein
LKNIFDDEPEQYQKIRNNFSTYEILGLNRE